MQEQSGFISIEVFQQVLQQLAGQHIYEALMKSYDLQIGRKHIVKSRRLEPRTDNYKIVEREYPDVSLQLGPEWVIVKQGRIIDRADSKSQNWFKSLPSVSSLVNVPILESNIDLKLSICITFADGQKLLTDNLWCLDTFFPRIRYEPMANSLVNILALDDSDSTSSLQ